MAETCANLASGGSDTDATSYLTSSVTPAANKLVFVSVCTTTRITADPNVPTLSGCGLTWVLVESTLTDSTSSSRRRLSKFAGMGSAPTTGQITVDLAGQTQTSFVYLIDQITNADTNGTNGSKAIVQHKSIFEPTTPITSLSVTFDQQCRAASGIYCVYGNGNTNTIVAGTGFTMVAHDTSPADGLGIWSEFRDNPTQTPGFTFPSDPENGMIATEVGHQPAGFLPLMGAGN